MADDPFERELAAMFAEAPADDADPAMFAMAVLARIEKREKRRRSAVLGAGLAGLAVAAIAFAAGGAGEEMTRSLGSLSAGASIWLWAGLAASALSVAAAMQRDAF